MIVIADTSPLSYLIRIGETEILPQLYRRVLIPAAVCDELTNPKAPEVIRLWIASPPAWIEVRTPQLRPDDALLSADLDAGERDAILLALELKADELIIDDMDGRREAEKRKLHFVGTLGVLRLAARHGLLDLQDALARLRATNFRVAQAVLDRLIKEQEE